MTAEGRKDLCKVLNISRMMPTPFVFDNEDGANRAWQCRNLF